MIWNEIRNRIEAKGDIQDQRIIAGIKKGKNTRIKRERESGSSQVVQSHRTPAQQKQTVQYLDVQIQGRQNATW